MATNKLEQCYTCRFWQRRNPQPDNGQCRRRSPVLWYCTDEHGTDWPETTASDGCGEYQRSNESLSSLASAVTSPSIAVEDLERAFEVVIRQEDGMTRYQVVATIRRELGLEVADVQQPKC